MNVNVCERCVTGERTMNVRVSLFHHYDEEIVQVCLFRLHDKEIVRVCLFLLHDEEIVRVVVWCWNVAKRDYLN